MDLSYLGYLVARRRRSCLPFVDLWRPESVLKPDLFLNQTTKRSIKRCKVYFETKKWIKSSRKSIIWEGLKVTIFERFLSNLYTLPRNSMCFWRLTSEICTKGTWGSSLVFGLLYSGFNMQISQIRETIDWLLFTTIGYC